MEIKCSECGKTLGANAIEGLCPECLMRVGVGSQTGTGGPEAGAKFTAPTPEEIAAHFPQLEILELVGRGGMGVVYKARQKQLGRIVALKILPPGVGDKAAFAERFAREARALATLSHPGIVTLYEFGQTNGLFFFLMEFVDGVNLRQLLHRGRVAPREALAIVPQICDALQYAHDQGIVHRDIKPENILLDRKGRVKVADFGLARLMGIEAEAASAGSGEAGSASLSLTEAGKVMGTPQYMAPEQKESPTEVDHRADIYSLGVVFYQMLTGQLPGKRIEAPSKKFHLDVRLDEVVLRALEKKPDLRYQQASVLKTDVETIAGGAPSQPPAARSQFAYFWEDVFPGCTSWPRFKNRYIRFWEKLFGDVTSSGAIMGFYLSLTGFIGFFALLAIIPGMRWSLPGLGFFPMLGLIGVAYVFEAAARSGVDLSQTCRLPDPNSQRGHWRRRIFWLIVAGIMPPMFLFAMSLIVLGARGGEKALEAATALQMALIFAKAIGMALGVSLIVWLWCRVFRKKSAEGVDVWPRHAERLIAFAIFWPVLAVAASVVIWEFATARVQHAVDWGREFSSLVGDGFSNMLMWAFIIWLLCGVPGIRIFRKAIVKCIGKTESRPEVKAPLPIQKPHRFWRRFVTFVVCMPLVLIAAVVAYRLLSQIKIAREQKVALLQGRNAGTLALPEVVVADRAAVVKQRQYNGEGLLFLFGDMTNRWEPKHLDSLFAVTLESHLFGHGADWVISSAHGNIGYNLETPTGAVTGEIVFHRGTPRPEPDGTYVIGEFQPDSPGAPGLPIAVKLVTGKPAQRPATGVSAFGPVIERQLSQNTQRDVCFIDLDRNKVFAPPRPDLSSEELDAWTTRNGIDAIAITKVRQTGDMQGLVGWNMRLLQVGPDNWQKLTPAKLAAQLESVQPMREVLLRGENALPATFLFKTCESNMGVLQITGFTENPRTVKIRYKLVQGAATSSVAPTAARNSSFGTVREFTLQSPAVARTNSFIDLERGLIVTPPAGLNLTNGDARFAWAQKSGVDAVACTEQRVRGLLGYGLHIVSVPDSEWNAATSDSILSNVVAQEFHLVESPPGNETSDRTQWSASANTVSTDPRPRTFAFRTRENRLGVLQLLQVSDEPGGFVKFRYKLFQPGSTASPTMPGRRKLDSEGAPAEQELRNVQPAVTNVLMIAGKAEETGPRSATPILAHEAALHFADPTASDGSFHGKPRTSFALDFKDQALIAITSLLIGQADFVLGLIGGPVGTRVEVQDMAGKQLVNETWDRHTDSFSKLITLPVDYSGKHYTCPVLLEFGRLPKEKYWGTYRFCAYLSGRVSLGGTEHQFELVNLDRRIAFLSPSQEEKPVEVLDIDLNGDGKIDPSPDGGEVFALDEPFAVGGRHYRLAQADASQLKVAFQEVTEPDYVKAQDLLRQAFGVAGALEETLDKKDDLKLAQNLVSQMGEQLRAYNELVRGTPVEWPQTNLEVVANLAKALQQGKWDEAKSATESGPELAGSSERLEDLAAIQRAQSFGPVVERVLPFKRKPGTPYCLDFESGIMMAPLGRLTLVDAGWDQWCAQVGVDAVAEERKSGPVLWGQRCIFAKVATARWDTIKPARVVKELIGNNVAGQADLPNREAVPATFLFKTREGARGVLQIAGLTDSPPGMRIRYKLVSAPAGMNAAVSEQPAR